MKKLILFFLVFILVSCSKEENFEQSFENTSIDKRQNRIAAVPLFHPCDADNLFVLVDLTNCIEGTLWDCAIMNSIDAYNNLPDNIGIGMTLITDINDLPEGQTVNITIDCGTLGAIANTVGRTTPNEISVITLNNTIENSWPCPTDNTANCCQLQKSVMHELGHALGFDHTGDNIPGAVHIPGTLVSEPTSIFSTTIEAGFCREDLCQFTNDDILAMGIEYPAVIAECLCPEFFEDCACEESISISFPTIWEEEGCIPENHFLTVCAYGWAGDPQPDVTYLWTATGSIVIETVDTDARCVQISVGTVGGEISVWATNEECGQNSIHRTIVICDEDEPGGGGTIPPKGRPKDIE